MTYYRYQELLWTDYRMSLTLCEFRVVKETPCGVQIEIWPGKNRFVNKYSRKKYACPSKEEALESYRARKRRQVSILKAQLKRAELALSLEEPDKMAWIGYDG